MKKTLLFLICLFTATSANAKGINYQEGYYETNKCCHCAEHKFINADIIQIQSKNGMNIAINFLNRANTPSLWQSNEFDVTLEKTSKSNEFNIKGIKLNPGETLLFVTASDTPYQLVLRDKNGNTIRSVDLKLVVPAKSPVELPKF